MKINHLKFAALAMAGTLFMSSCVGSFGLFNKLASWNKSATNSKFLNEIIFLLISPAYAVCGVVDVFVLNTIEFWSGNNPMSQNIGKTKQVMGKDGKYYAVTTLKNGYLIKTPEGKELTFVHNQKDDSWAEQKDGKSTEIFRFNKDGSIKATLPNGGKMDVTQDEAGVYQTRMAVNNGMYFAMR
jgi:hypothetical protein